MGKKQAVNATQTVQAHDREKQRYLQQGNAFLKELGITDEKLRSFQAWLVSGNRLINLSKFLQVPMNKLMRLNKSYALSILARERLFNFCIV